MTASWLYQPAADFAQPWLARWCRVSRQRDMLVYCLRLLAALSLRLFLRTYHRLQIVGRENLPRQGSFILVANHASHLDGLCLLSSLPLGRIHQAFPVAAADYFFANRRRTTLAVIFANAVPFARKAHLRSSLALCRRLLATPGNVLILFPEGTRSPTGELGEFRPGIGSLLAGTDIPVVPCAIQGAYRAWPKGAWLPRPRGLRLVIGPPRQFAHLPPGRQSSNFIAAQLHDAVRELQCR